LTRGSRYGIKVASGKSPVRIEERGVKEGKGKWSWKISGNLDHLDKVPNSYVLLEETKKQKERGAVRIKTWKYP